MGETPMPLSNTPCHSPLKQQAVTRRVVKLTPKKWSIHKITASQRKNAALTHLLRSKRRLCFGLLLAVHYFYHRDTEKSIVYPIWIVGIPSVSLCFRAKPSLCDCLKNSSVITGRLAPCRYHLAAELREPAGRK